MCIIIAKKAGIALPSKETLERCWTVNPDGAGIAYRIGKNVEVVKGIMKLKSLHKILHQISEQHNITELDMMIHFRIATTGSVKPSNTHPFFVQDGTWLAHNGMLPYRPVTDITDSQYYVENVVRPLIDYHSLNGAKDLLESTSQGSRLCILDRHHGLITTGTWHTDTAGVKYSNATYKPYEYKYAKNTKYSWLDEAYTTPYSYLNLKK